MPPPVSQKRAWLRFVNQRRRELHDEYPCSMPTKRRWCPKHRLEVPQETHVKKYDRELDEWVRVRVQLTGICKPCRDELYGQLADEYQRGKEKAMEKQTESPLHGPTAVDEVISLVEQDKGDTMERFEPPASLTLFGTNDPTLALQRMSTVASALVDVIRDRGLVVKIHGREHLTAEAWTTLGGMLGVVPVVEWTRQLEDGTGWEARVEARTLDGRIVGAAESMCTRAEPTWRKREEFALRSMAQTRAIGRALRAPLGQIVRLAGYDPAGAEELPAEDAVVTAEKIPAEGRPTNEQMTHISQLLTQLAARDPGTDWKEEARRLAGVSGDMLTSTIAAKLIDELREGLNVAGAAR
jgi:hypothetical protein